MDCSLPAFSVHGIFQARVLEWGAIAFSRYTGVGFHFLLQCMKVKSESEIAQSCPTPSNPIDREEHTSELQSHIGKGNGNPLQYSCLENPRDAGAWWGAVHGVAQSRTQLKRRSSSILVLICVSLVMSAFQHSSVLSWRIPGMGEPGGLPSMGLHRLGHD